MSSKDQPKNVVLFAVSSDMSVPFYRRLATDLAQKGWSVHFSASGGPNLTALARSGVIPHPIDIARDPAPAADVASLVAIFALLRRVRPQIVIAGTPKASLLFMVAARAAGIPNRIYHVLGLRFETTQRLRRLLLKLLERCAALAATRVLAVSKSLRDALITHRIAPARKVDLLGLGSTHGVDISHFTADSITQEQREHLRRSLKLATDTVVIGFIGRLHPDKGISDLLSALSTVNETTHVTLLAIGDADHPLASLDHQAVPIIRVGHVLDTRPYYSLIDIFCLPTYREGLPNVNLEAAAMGLPVITTSATGATDSIVHGVTGIRVPPGDVPRLTQALEALIFDANLRAAYGTAGRAWVAEHFSADTVNRRSVSYISHILFSSAIREDFGTHADG